MTGMDEYDRNLAFVSINTAQKMFNMKDKVSGYIINSDTKTDELLNNLDNNIQYPYFLETWKDRHQIIFAWIRTQKVRHAISKAPLFPFSAVPVQGSMWPELPRNIARKARQRAPFLPRSCPGRG